MMNKRWLAVLAAGIALLIPAVAYAQTSGDDGLLLRIGGTVTVAADEDVETLIVIDGDAVVLGTVEDIVVIDGSVTLTDAAVRNLVVISGDATLTGSTVISEDVRLIDGNLDRGADIRIQGSVIEGGEVGFGAALGVISVLIYLGISVALVVLALAVAAVAGRPANAAGLAITNETGKVVVAAILLWVFVPIAAGLALITVIGIPTGLMILVMVLPVMAVLGYVVAGIRLGTWILGRARPEALPAHPYLGALVGVGLLQLVGWVPVLGFLVASLVGLAGTGAIALLAWRSVQDRGEPASAEADPGVVPASEA